MKKIITAAALFLTFSLSAQDFPGNSVEELNGKEIILMEEPFFLENGYAGFYNDSGLKKTYKKQGTYTKADAVVGKPFKVTDTKPSGSNQYTLTLQNKDTGTIYYQYRSDKPYSFNFEIVGGSLSENVYCDQLIVRKEWSHTEAKDIFWSQAGPVDDITFSDDKKTSGAPYEMKLYLEGVSKTKENIKGFTIFLENGKTIVDNSTKVNVSPAITSGMYKFEVKFIPTDTQIAELTSSKIVKISMGSHERKILGGKLLMYLIKCITK